MARGGGGGNRICLDQRPINDSAEPIAASEALHPEDAKEIEETESKSMNNCCRRDYQNRLKRYMVWLEALPDGRYSEYYQTGIRKLTDEEMAIPNRYYFWHTRDFIYTGFRVDFFKAFLSNIKVKKQDEDGNDILKSLDNLRKYGDAIRWAT